MKANPLKHRSYKTRSGEIYIKVTDGNFNNIYESKIGISDKKAVRKMIVDLHTKGIDLYYNEKDVPEDLWW